MGPIAEGKQEVDVDRTRPGWGLGRNDRRMLELEEDRETNIASFPSPHPNREREREGRLTRLNLANRQAGQIDTLMRFTDEGEGEGGGGDNSFVPLARLCQDKCIRTRKVRPKQICTPNHSRRTGTGNLNEFATRKCFQIGPVVHKSRFPLKDLC